MAQNQATLQNPGQLQGTVVRQGNVISQNPITPAGQKTIGANPDQAKMAGTPAQKTPVIEKAVAAPLAQAPKQLGAQGQQQVNTQQQQADALAMLGGFNGRVQKLVETKFNALQGAAKPLAESFADSFDTSKLPAGTTVQQLLDQYATKPNDQTPLTALSKALKVPGAVTANDVANWYNTGGKALGQSAASEMSDNVLMSDFDPADFQQLGFTGGLEQVANAVGLPPAQVQALTVSEFEDVVKAQIDRTQSTISSLQAELVNSVPGSAYAQQIQQKIADLSGAGLASTERRMDELAAAVQDFDQVTIGGQPRSVADLLKDDALSQLIVDYVTADAAGKDKIFPPGQQFEGLRAWIAKNDTLLKGLATEMQATAGSFSQAQTDFKSFQDSLNQDLLGKVAADAGLTLPAAGTQTAAQLEQLKGHLKTNPAIALMQSAPADLGVSDEQKQQLLGDLTKNYDSVKSLGPKQIVEAWQAAQTLKNDPDLAQLLGYEPSDFVSDIGRRQHIKNFSDTANKFGELQPGIQNQLLQTPEVLEMIRQGKITFDILNAAGDLTTSDGRALLTSPEIVDLIRRGTITNKNVYQTLPVAAQSLDSFHQAQQVQQRLKQAKSSDEMLQALLQDPLATIAKMNNSRNQLQERANMGDPTAVEAVRRFDEIDPARNGIDQADVARIANPYKNLNLDTITLGQSPVPDIVKRLDQVRGVGMADQRGAGIFGLVQDLLKGGLTLEEKQRLAGEPELEQLSARWRELNLPPEMRTATSWETEKQRRLLQQQRDARKNLKLPDNFGMPGSPGKKVDMTEDSGPEPLSNDLNGDGYVDTEDEEIADSRLPTRDSPTKRLNRAKDKASKKLAKTDWSFKDRPY